jgi:hypothetical protein
MQQRSHVVFAPTNSETTMRVAMRQSGILTQGKIAMTKNIALAASISTLIAISGQAFADTAPKNAPEATALSDQQVVNALNAFDPAFATQTTELNAYRYHGGPKSND